MAKSSWCQVAQLEEGRFLPVPPREKWLWGFLVFYVCLFVSVGCCPSSDLHRFAKLSYELELTCTGLIRIVHIENPQSTINFGPNDFSLENGPNWKFSPGAKNLARAVFLMMFKMLGILARI